MAIIQKIKLLLFNRLWKKFTFLLLFLITSPIVLLGYFLVNNGQEAVRNSVFSNYEEIVKRAAEEIESIVNTPQELLVNIARIIEIIPQDVWHQESVLVELALNHSSFVKIVLVSPQGNVIASSDMNHTQLYQKEAFDAALLGTVVVSPVMISKNYFPYRIIAVPIRREAVVSEVLIAEVNLQEMWNVIDSINIGSTGIVYVVSDTGVLIAHKDRKRVFQNEFLFDRPEVQAVLQGKSEAIESENYIYAYVFVRSLKWGVILRQSTEEAYYFSKILKFQSMIILVLGECLAIVISLLLAEALSSPLKKLIAQMRNVAQGDFDHTIDNRRSDEIGDLISTFNDMVGKLKAARMKERLAAVGEASLRIVHEFKNSLCSVKSFIQLFPEHHEQKEFIEHFNQNVPQEMQRLEKLMSELSDYTKETHLCKAKMDCKELLETIISSLRDYMHEGNITLEARFFSADTMLEGDTEHLREVVRNLLFNAVQAIGTGGTVTLSLKDASLKNYLEIGVKDTGPGIAPELQAKIFEPFFSTKRTGLGLGLSYCKKIIELHGGQLLVESGLGQGTTFRILLPRLMP